MEMINLNRIWQSDFVVITQHWSRRTIKTIVQIKWAKTQKNGSKFKSNKSLIWLDEFNFEEFSKKKNCFFFQRILLGKNESYVRWSSFDYLSWNQNFYKEYP